MSNNEVNVASGQKGYQGFFDAMQFVRAMGEDIAKSGMFGCQSLEQGRILALTCWRKGLDPLSLIERYHLINGDLSMRSDAMLAALKGIRGAYRVLLRTPEVASIEILIGGQTQVFTLTWAEAEQEPFTRGKKGEIKANYATPRARMQMLWARVVSDGVRTMAPEVVCGTYTPEELDDSVSTIESEAVLELPKDSAVAGDSNKARQESAAAETKPAPAETKSVPVETKPAPTETRPESGEEYCTHEQSEEIRRIFIACELNADQQLAMIKQRGCNSLRSLPKLQALELLAELHGLASKMTSASRSGPCDANQVVEIKTLLAELEQSEPATFGKVLELLREAKITKLAQLTYNEADGMIGSLRVKQILAFFKNPPKGFSPGN